MARSILSLFLGALAAGVLAPGCEPARTNAPPGDDHAHKPGAHGGNVVAIGRDRYHAEAVFEKGGRVRLYLLGADESRVQEVEAQTLRAHVRAEGELEYVPFELTAAPSPDDAPGKTSCFAGTLPDGLAGRRVEAVVP